MAGVGELEACGEPADPRPAGRFAEDEPARSRPPTPISSLIEVPLARRPALFKWSGPGPSRFAAARTLVQSNGLTLFLRVCHPYCEAGIFEPPVAG